MAKPAQVKKYREQVVSVDGMQFDGTNQQLFVDWGEGVIVVMANGDLQVNGAFTMTAKVTDWVLQDPWKNWLVMKDADFQITYAPGP